MFAFPARDADSSLAQTLDDDGSAKGFPGDEAEQEIHSNALADSVETTALPQTPPRVQG